MKEIDRTKVLKNYADLKAYVVAYLKSRGVETKVTKADMLFLLSYWLSDNMSESMNRREWAEEFLRGIRPTRCSDAEGLLEGQFIELDDDTYEGDEHARQLKERYDLLDDRISEFFIGGQRGQRSR